jgi:hypothetical protein
MTHETVCIHCNSHMNHVRTRRQGTRLPLHAQFFHNKIVKTPQLISQNNLARGLSQNSTIATRACQCHSPKQDSSGVFWDADVLGCWQWNTVSSKELLFTVKSSLLFSFVNPAWHILPSFPRSSSTSPIYRTRASCPQNPSLSVLSALFFF